MTRINDGQLDSAERRIAELERQYAIVCGVCARRLDLLGRVVESRIGFDHRDRMECRVSSELWQEICNETDENEVQP